LEAKSENVNTVHIPEVAAADQTAGAGVATVRKAFVEPEVSFPVDVLEATTFFQTTESGVTNP
jgi:hypothetical protein